MIQFQSRKKADITPIELESHKKADIKPIDILSQKKCKDKDLIDWNKVKNAILEKKVINVNWSVEDDSRNTTDTIDLDENDDEVEKMNQSTKFNTVMTKEHNYRLAAAKRARQQETLKNGFTNDKFKKAFWTYFCQSWQEQLVISDED